MSAAMTTESSRLEQLTDLVGSLWPHEACVQLGESSDQPCSAYDHELRFVQHLSDKLASVSYHLMRKRNWHVKINTLPDNVLQKIFRIAGRCGKGHTTNRAIVRTCTRWCKISLNDPSMWANVNIERHNSHALKTFRRLNQSVPFTIISKGWDDSLSLFAKDTEYLMLNFPSKAHFHRPSAEHALSFDELKHLSIQLSYPDDSNRIGEIISSDKLATIIPNQLQRLSLSGCHFPWSSRLYENLSELSIEFDGFDCAGPLLSSSLDESTLALVHMAPNLRMLELKLREVRANRYQQISPEPQPRPPLSHPVNPIPMRSLRSVTLDLPLDAMLFILRSIVLSTDKLTDLCLDIRTKDNKATDLVTFFTELPIPLTLLSITRSLTIQRDWTPLSGMGLRGTGREDGSAYSWAIYVTPLADSSHSHDPAFPPILSILPAMLQLEEFEVKLPDMIWLFPDRCNFTREEAVELTAPLTLPTTRITRLTISPFAPVLFTVLAERFVEALRTHAPLSTTLEELVIRRPRNFVLSYNDRELLKIMPLCELLPRLQAFRCLIIDTGDIHNSMTAQLEQLFQELEALGIPEVRRVLVPKRRVRYIDGWE